MAVGCSGSTNDGDDSPNAFPNHRQTFDSAGRRLGYVPNRNSDTVSVLDLDAMELLGSVPVGRDPVDIDGPRHLMLDPANDLAYVGLSYPFSVTSAHAVAQGATLRSGYVQALNLTDLSIAGDLRVDPKVGDIAFSPASNRLVVAHADDSRSLQPDLEARRANLVFVDPASSIAHDKATATRQTVCAVPSTLAFDGDGARVFVACTGEDSLVVVDAATRTVLSRGPAGPTVPGDPAASFNKPYALVIDPARQRLLVSNEVSRTVAMFDLNDTPNLLSSHRFVDPTGNPDYSVPMFSALISDSLLAVPLQSPSGAALLDVASGDQLLRVMYSSEECVNPAEFSVTSDSRLFLVCEGDHYHPGAVVAVDPDTLAVIASIPVELYPERMTIREP
jgi:YVTN family beta-propeller protein